MFDNKTLSKLIDQIYASAIEGSWHDTINKIRLLTHSNKIFFVIKSLNNPEPLAIEFVAGFDYDPKILISYSGAMEDDPWYQIAQLSLQGDILKHSELKPVDSFEHTPIYQDIFLPMRSYHCMGAVLLRNEEYEATFAINRGKNDLAYSDADYELLELVVPHLTRAIGLYIELKAYKNIANIAEGIARSSSKAIFLCDKDANILELNELAINLLNHSNYFIPNQQQLNLAKDYLNANVKTIIADNASFSQDNIRCRQVLILDEDEEKLILKATPLMEKHAVVGGEVNCCLVTITPENTVDWEAVSSEYRLTARESEVSRLIYTKKRVMDIADLLCMKENTVRTHVQNIYAKLRVNTQAEFMLALNMFSS